MTESVEVQVSGQNGRAYRRSVEPRLLLPDFLRRALGLTGGPRRLRARVLQDLHHPCGRRDGAVVPDAGGAG